jgi:hypothetical protein
MINMDRSSSTKLDLRQRITNEEPLTAVGTGGKKNMFQGSLGGSPHGRIALEMIH